MSVQLWLNHAGAEAPSPEVFRSVERPYRWNKPRGGLWTSSPGHPHGWLRRIADGDVTIPMAHSAWLLTVSPDALTFEISTPDDLQALADRFPDRIGAQTPPEPAEHCGIDWLTVADAFDGVHLTGEGFERLAQSTVMLDGLRNLCGWDCECTLWLKWAFVGVAEVDA